MPLKNKIQLIAYPNRIGDNLNDLYSVLNRYLKDAVKGVHILPMYPSNADNGFSPLTHKEVDPAFGDWAIVEKIAKSYDLCVDLTLNHISDESKEFKDFLKNKDKSKFADLFNRISKFRKIKHEDLAKVHIRKEKEPFRKVKFEDGSEDFVWCTFTEHQIDLNYSSPKTYQFMNSEIKFLAKKGAKLLRLDAFGYTTKEIGTSCFLVEPEIYGVLDKFKKMADAAGVEILPEVHDHPSYQTAISNRGAYAYAFALPLLVLYSLIDNNSTYLKHWLRNCPHKQVTVLDTHDGICIPDVEGLLPESRVEALIKNVSERSGDPILRRSAANVHSVGAIYQLTCTFYDALKQNDDAYIAARAIQFFTPGIPQVYYVGLVAGENDQELMEETGEFRDINRSYYSLQQFARRLRKPVVKRLMRLMKFRNEYPAFDGQFAIHYSTDQSIALSWQKGKYRAELFVDMIFNKTVISHFDVETEKMRRRTV